MFQFGAHESPITDSILDSRAQQNNIVQYIRFQLGALPVCVLKKILNCSFIGV